MINLPSKDKNGNSFLSYSQISCFLKDKNEYYKRYILKEPFEGNEYIDFGLKVSKAIELNDYTKFSEKERKIISNIKRLDFFERKCILNYDNFYVIGFIDSCSSDFSEIIDYKTGGKNKEKEYLKDSYTQLCYYALSIRQETGITPQKASVQFIRRHGNLYRDQILTIANEPIIDIPIDISENRLKSVYYNTIDIAKDIELFYLNNMKS